MYQKTDTEKNKIKMKMKKLAVALLTVAMSLTAVSCGDENESSLSESQPESSVAETTEPETTTVAEETTAESTEATTGEIPAEENPLGSTADINDYIKSTAVNPPLWKVTDPETNNSIYLLGTIHMLPEDAPEYPDTLMEIYSNCDSIAVEYDVTALTEDASAQMEYLQGMIYADNTTIKDHISEETYNKAKGYFESLGAYSEMLDQYTAGYWINQLSSVMYLRLENMNYEGTDTYFINKAKEDGKDVINIEELSAQTNALNAFSDDYADYNMSEMIDNINEIGDFAQTYSEMYDLWASGDGEISVDMDTDIDELPDDLIDDHAEYVQVVITDRNKNMAERASEIIKENNNCLFMVGSAHYSGENGVDNLLEGMGYTVEKIA